MFRSASQQQAMVAAAAEENAKKACIAAIYAERQDFVRGEANDRMILETILDWTQNPDVLPTKEIFDQILLKNPEAISRFARRPLNRVKEQLIEEILRLLAAHGARHDKYTLKAEENRLKHYSIEALRIRLSEIKTKQRMNSEPLAALKKLVADAHRDDRPYPGWPTLPNQIVPRGGIYSVNVTAEYLNQLARTDIYEFKRLVRLFGSEQVDFRRGIKK